MNRGILAAVIIYCMSGIYLSAQVDTSGKQIPLRTLDIDQLNYPVDSSRMSMITAGRISKRLDEVPLQVYVITEEEIYKNQYTTLTEVLLALPGIQVSMPGTGELGESFQIWNLTGNLYTKILINGVPVKPSVVAGMPIGSQLPIRQAERIEIIYGNSSAVYGADAVSGVINIITREATEGAFVRGDISLGRNGHNYINFSVGGKGGKNNNILQYNFYGSRYELNDMNLDYAQEGLYNPLNYYQSRGSNLTIGAVTINPREVNEPTLEQNGITVEEFKQKFYGENYEGSLTMPDMEAISSGANMLGMQLNYRGFGLSYNYMYRNTHSSLGLSPVFYKYNNPQNFWGERIQQFSLNYTKKFKKFTSTTQLNNLAYEMDNNSSQGLTQNVFTEKAYRYSASNDIEFSQVFSATLFKKVESVAGVSYTQSGNLPTTNYLTSPFDRSLYDAYAQEIDTAYISPFGRFGINPVLFSNTSAFLQFYTQWKNFRFLGGIRNDINTLVRTNNISPHFAVLHKTSDRTSIRLSVGTAYKIPPTSLIYQSLVYPVNDSMIHLVSVPAESMRPEKFTTFEIGFVTNFSPRFTLEQTFFSYRIRNHIVPIQESKWFMNIPDNIDRNSIINDSVGHWVNLGNSVSTVGGSQTTLRFTNIVRSIKLNAEVHLYFQARQDKLPNVVEIVEEYFKLSPRHTGKMKVSMQPTDNFYLYIESHWMSKWLRVLIPFEELYDGIFGKADGYYAMNAVANYSISDQLNLYLKATNIFDEKYGVANPSMLEPGLLYNPQLRRTIRVGLSYKLN
ncbi:MAG: TonB-dependent receptor plug domain-containing protein [Bacteroidales bacterium]